MERFELIAMGYCRTSNAYGIITRIDRPDWKEYMADKHAPWSREEGMEWVRAIGKIGAEDWYRRCLSKDKIELGKGKAKNFPASHETLAGYVEVNK